MKRKVAMAVLIVMLAVTCMSMMCACVKDEKPPIKIDIEVINPKTGEPIQNGDIIDLPEEDTPIEARFKEQETGEYITNVDLPGQLLLKDCYHANFRFVNLKLNEDYQIYCENWPIKEIKDRWNRYDHFELIIFFDCKPDNIKDSAQIERKYEMKSYSVMFDIRR